jgi:hypothetical protein
VRCVRLLACLASSALLGLTAGVGPASAASTSAAPLRTPNGTQYRPLTFPVAGPVTYHDDFGDCRDGCKRRHQGNDLMGTKLEHEVAAHDGTVTFVRSDASGTSGNMLDITDADSWTYVYIHINNDTPGTDDGANPAQWRFAPGIKVGTHVKAGQFVAYMGDSGNAESTGPHLHFELHRPDGTAISPYTSLRLAQGLPANGQCHYPMNPTPHPSPSAGKGYWVVGNDGEVFTFGAAQTYSASASNVGGAASGDTWMWPVVGIAAAPNGKGYWVVDDRGTVVAYGSAKYFGGTDQMNLNQPIISMTPTVSGNGYWLLAKDGGIFSFGDARFYGSMGDKHLNAPIVGMAAAASGKGYWLLGRDGGIFTFGRAHFYGSTGAMKLVKPVLSMAATKDGKGYWLVAGDGGMFSFGDAAYRGSLPGTGVCDAAALSMAATSTGKGYWILQPNGAVAAYGDAKYYGSASGSQPLALAAMP